MRTAPMFLLASLALLVALPGAVRADDDAPPRVTLEAATGALERFEETLRSRRSVNDELLAGLRSLAAAWQHLEGPPTWEPIPVPEDATEEERDVVEDENRDGKRTWRRAYRRYVRNEERFRDDAVDAFLDALALVETHRGSEYNIREPVNIEAARILGALGRPEIAKDMQRVLERKILDAKHDVTPKLLHEVFTGLARLGNIDTLEWLVDEFAHTRSTPQSAVDQLKAAHQAMLLFPADEVPGELRYEIVEQFVRMYAGTESVAHQGAADAASQRARMFWGEIGAGVLEVLQQFSGTPVDERGVALATVDGFQDWFREHKHVRRAPWKDEDEND